jgi:hypothetical protein
MVQAITTHGMNMTDSNAFIAAAKNAGLRAKMGNRQDGYREAWILDGDADTILRFLNEAPAKDVRVVDLFDVVGRY